jgi:hypothetical protein
MARYRFANGKSQIGTKQSPPGEEKRNMIRSMIDRAMIYNEGVASIEGSPGSMALAKERRSGKL